MLCPDRNNLIWHSSSFRCCIKTCFKLVTQENLCGYLPGKKFERCNKSPRIFFFYSFLMFFHSAFRYSLFDKLFNPEKQQTIFKYNTFFFVHWCCSMQSVLNSLSELKACQIKAQLNINVCVSYPGSIFEMIFQKFKCMGMHVGSTNRNIVTNTYKIKIYNHRVCSQSLCYQFKIFNKCYKLVQRFRVYWFIQC